MSMSEPSHVSVSDAADSQNALPAGENTAPQRSTPLLAAGSIAGRALVIVVAIMTFLASMTISAAFSSNAALDWARML